MMKVKTFRFPRIDELNCRGDLAVVITRDDDYLAKISRALNQSLCFACGGAVVHQIPQNDQSFRPIIFEEREQPRTARLHSPERKKITRGALAQFITEMQIGHGQPFLSFMEEGEARVEQHISCDQNLTRS
ncbi:MAG: hypothetical protein QOE73_1252 [Verrucomicrobiota bacterium]